MSNSLKFKIVISEKGDESFSAALSFEDVMSIVQNCPDDAKHHEFFALAARHPASSVREAVACKDCLAEETVRELCKDSSISVLRNLVRSLGFRKYAPEEEVLRLLGLDSEIAQSVADNLESFQQLDASELASILAEHQDPSVVASVAGNYSAPKKIVKGLVGHPDPYVARQAVERLKEG